jgi:CheY-like chemotaxis protein
MNRSILKTLVEMRGHFVTAVSNGDEVLREVERNEHDVVLMDVHMPVLDGLEATPAVRRQETGGRHLPIVALTAESAPGLLDRYLAAGITEYLAKPVKVEALFAVIDDLGRHKDSERDRRLEQ